MDEKGKTSAGTLTKVLFAVYIVSGLASLAMTIALVCLAALAVLDRSPRFKIDGLPYLLAVLTMLAAKIATRWSLRRDESKSSL